MTVQTLTANTLIELPNAAIEPPPITQWPIAPGYWLVSCMLLAALGCLFIRYRSNLWRRQALTELKGIYQDYLISADPYLYCKHANALLKRVALTRFPKELVAPLSGSEWLAFLDASCAKVHFSDHFDWFASLPYQETLNTAELSVLKLHSSIKRWIKHHQIKSSNCIDADRQHQGIRQSLFQGATP